MGLLDKINPKKPEPRPTDLAFDDQGALLVRWDDGRESRFDARWLRGHCPCAECVEEWSGKRTVGVEQVGQDVKPQGMHQVEIAEDLGAVWEGDELVTYDLEGLTALYEYHQSDDYLIDND